MAKILIGTEADEGLGHVLPWVAFVRQARAVRHCVQIAAPNVGAASEFLGELAVDIWQSPRLRFTPPCNERAPKSWPELLISLGYGQPQQLLGVVRAWCSVLKHARPEFVFADYAPALMIACHVLNVRVFEVGTGFCVPPVRPAVTCFPGIKEANTDRIEITSDQLVHSINLSLTALGSDSRLHSYEDLHDFAASRIVLSPPRFDHYGERANVAYAGFRSGCNLNLGREPIGEHSNPDIQVVGYLKNSEMELHEIAQQLTAEGISGLIYAPNFSKAGQRVSGSVEFTNDLLDFEWALPRANFFLSNGGFAGVTQALGVGCWPVVVPQQVEQVALGRILINAGIGSLWLPSGRQEPAKVVRNIFSSRPKKRQIASSEFCAEAFLLDAIARSNTR